MKGIVLLISVVHLVLAFSSPCATATTTPNGVVLDTNRSAVVSGRRYFVVSALIGVPYRGVRRDLAKNEAGDADFVCPSRVVESPQYGDKGMAVVFKPKDAKQVEIIESTDLNIEFYNDNPTWCNNVVWEVDGFPGSPPPMFLSTNGVAGNPMNVSSWFRIMKVKGNYYKLVFCPFGEDICSDIGIKDVDGQSRLAIGTNNTFYVRFILKTGYGINSII